MTFKKYVCMLIKKFRRGKFDNARGEDYWGMSLSRCERVA